MSFQDDQQSPWGSGGNRQPTPEDLIKDIINKLKSTFAGFGQGSGGTPPGNGGGSRATSRSKGPGISRLLLIIAIILIFQVGNSAFFKIQPGEQGVILRFGKYIKTASPGLNFKIPMVDEVIKVDVKSVRKEEFGFRTQQAARQTTYKKEEFDAESLMLTADKNVIDVEWIVQYKVRDPRDFIFKVRDVSQAVRDLAETAGRRIVGNMDFDYVLSNREILAAAISKELQDTLNRYESGVDIGTVQLQDVNPPQEVKPAFNEVNEADQDMKRLVNEAEEAYNQVIPKARGQALEKLEEAHGYAVERVNLAKGETTRFLSVLKEYQAAKEVTRQRLYIETMQAVLPSLTEIYVLDKDQRSLLPFLNVTGKGSDVK